MRGMIEFNPSLLYAISALIAACFVLLTLPTGLFFTALSRRLALLVRGLANPDNNQLTAAKWSPFLDPESWTAYLLPGLVNTLQAAGLAVVLSLVVGFALGVGRLSTARVVRGVCGALVEFLRSVPVLIMKLFVYYFCIYVLGVLGDASTFIGVVGGPTLYNSAVIAELVRSGWRGYRRGSARPAWRSD